MSNLSLKLIKSNQQQDIKGPLQALKDHVNLVFLPVLLLTMSLESTNNLYKPLQAKNIHCF